jgi:cobalt-zinc-cadmium efflux system outer membrane protein
MRIGIRAAFAGYAFLCLGFVIGCRSGASQHVHVQPQNQPTASPPPPSVDAALGLPATMAVVEEPVAAPNELPPDVQVRPAAHVESAADEEVATPHAEHQAGAALQVDSLVAEVLAVNPDIRAASAAWRAAAHRYPQEVSLDDPMFGYMLGPGSWGSDEVNDAYTLEASQKLPWPGKRQLRGNIARAEANAAYYDVGEQRLRIAETTRLVYYEYYLAHRQLAVLVESNKLLQDFRQIALSRYESATVEQQDVLLADVELADLQRRLLELTRAEQVARARINTLLLVAANAPLPPPPVELSTADKVRSPEELRSLALSQRPELAAQAARIRAEQYAVALAYKEFYPDVEVVARYDAFWQEEPLRPMVGMNLNLPIYKEKRRAAVCEARARITKEQAELDAKINEIMFEVEQSYRRVEESRSTLAVYQTSILPTVRHSVDAARASYLAGRLDFLRLVASQRQLLEMQDRYYMTVAEYRRRHAELMRLIGDAPYAPVVSVGQFSSPEQPLGPNDTQLDHE